MKKLNLRDKESALLESERKLSDIYASMSEGLAIHEIIYDNSGKAVDYVITEVNPAFEKITGLARSQALGKKASSLYSVEEAPYLEIYSRVAATRSPEFFETYFQRMNKYFSISVFSPAKGKFATIFQDITERKQVEWEREAVVEFLSIINDSSSLNDMIKLVVSFIKRKSGFEAVGIRLKKGYDYPYYETSGFTSEFVLSENHLCGSDPAGRPLRDVEGYPIMECMCGNVIQGRFDPSKNFFTKRGSFWSNNTTELLATSTEADRQARTRNRCNGEGYESVGLFALRLGGERLGLLQLNDKRKGMFTSASLALWERLADFLSVALSNFESEQALAKSKKDYERAQAVGNIGNWRLNVQRNELIWSDENYRIFGIPKGTPLTYEIFLSTIHPDDRDYVDKKWKAGMAGEDYDIEHRIVANGAVKWVREKAFLEFDERGAFFGGFGITQDITERKMAEEVLKRDKETFEKLVQERTRELVEAQAELERTRRLSDIGVLAATVAHELRNPLTAISVAAYNIKKKAKSPEIDKNLASIDKKVTESDQIINNLLFYSRLKPPRHESVNIFDIIEECAETLKKQDKREVAVIKELDSIRNAMIEADQIQIKEVFHNILNNAQDAVPSEKGRIRIVAENEEDFIKVAVEDNGTGIDKEILDKVFDPFFTTKAKGTGLGLSVCKHIVTMHEGEIWVKSEAGQGTFVIVRLPKKA